MTRTVRSAKRCRLGPVWHAATHRPRLLLHDADAPPFARTDPDRMTLDLPVCQLHQDRAVQIIRDEAWREIVAWCRRHRAPRPDASRVGVEWIPLQ